MAGNPETWAVVLAGGEGTRLKEMTTTAQGITIPKQYCSVRRRTCLLEDAVGRASSVSLSDRICTVVAAQHQRWWAVPLRHMPPENIFIQPGNSGTAHGILFALLQIEHRDPNAVVILLPADHYLKDEAAMAASLRSAARHARERRDLVFLLGAKPENADSELGYIVPTAGDGSLALGVKHFVEKPDTETAEALVNEGALWNVFVLAGSISAFLNLYSEEFVPTIDAMRAILRESKNALEVATRFQTLYSTLGAEDFSGRVLEAHSDLLRVLEVPRCGWTDLGTPNRVKATVHHLDEFRSAAEVPTTPNALYLDLARQATRREPKRAHNTAT